MKWPGAGPQTLRALWRFLEAPGVPLAGFGSRRAQWMFYARLMGLALLVQLAWAIATSGLRESAGAQHMGYGAMNLGLYLTLALLVPAYEETLFRSWLVNPLWLLAVAAFTVVDLLGMSFFATVQLTIYLLMPVALWLNRGKARPAGQKGVAFGFRRRWVRGRLLMRRMLPWTVPASTLVFGFAHVGNWDAHAGEFWTLPLLVFPQLLSGAVFAYARVRTGLHVSMALHASLNATTVGIMWLASAFGPAP